MTTATPTLCPACDLLQRTPPLPPRGAAHCVRCGQLLHRHRPDSLNRTLALTLAGIILFIVANAYPFLAMEIQGQVTESTLLTGVKSLTEQGKGEVAAVVLFTSVLAPGLQLLLLLVVLLPLKLGWPLLPGYPVLFRWFKTLLPWGMMDVFMLGILVAVVKLVAMATIVPGPSLVAFVLLIFVLAAAQAALDPALVWARVALPPTVRAGTADAIARGRSLLSCEVCELAVPAAVAQTAAGRCRCPRCGNPLHRRKPRSLQRTWALVLAALVFYIPANVYPVMSVTSLGQTQADTILSGVIYLFTHGMWPLALVVFIASVFVPLLKLALLVFLLVSVQLRVRWRPRDRTRLYRITEAMGRWSMVDVFVVTILVALVRLGNLASIEAEAGAVFFCTVVIVTMLAAMAFDPRLIWDTAGESPVAAGRPAAARPSHPLAAAPSAQHH